MAHRRNDHQRKLQAYRIDKHIPRRSKITIEEDLGKRRSIETLSTPHLERSERNYPKKWGGELVILFNRNGFKIKQNIKNGRIFMYGNDECIGEIETPDLYALGLCCLKHIGAFTEVIYKKVKKKKYVRYMLRSGINFYKYPKWARKLHR